MTFEETLCGEGDSFWNSSLSWDTPNPSLTKCFRKTVLLWIPATVLTAAALPGLLFRIGRRKNQKYDLIGPVVPSPAARWLLACRIILFFTVALLAIAELFFALDEAALCDHLYCAVLCSCCALSVAVSFAQGGAAATRSSGALFCFWFLAFLLDIPSFLSAVVEEGQEDVFFSNVRILLFVCFGSLAALHSFGCSGVGGEAGASLPSRLTFHWMMPLLSAGHRKMVGAEDFPQRGEDVQLEYIKGRFDHFLDLQRKDHQSKGLKEKHRVRILPILLRSFFPEVVLAALLKIVNDVLLFAAPQILRLIIRVLTDGDYSWKGYFFSGLLVACGVMGIFCFHIYHRTAYTSGLQMRTAVVSAVYRKALRISPSASSRFTTGQITNLMSVDAFKFLEVMMNINVLWSGPLKLALAIYFLHDLVGLKAAGAGISVLLVCIPLQSLSAGGFRALQTKQVKHKDERIKLTNEVLQGIKAIKFSAWEEAFADKIISFRAKEISCFKATAKIWATMNSIFALCPGLVTLATFATYVYTAEPGTENLLTAEKAFACIAIIAIIRVPMFQWPHFVIETVRLFVSVKRIDDFLNCDEVEDVDDVGSGGRSVLTTVAKKEDAVELESASLSWDKGGKCVLEEINVEVKKGELVAVIGPVGAGKSSLLSALLGEMLLEEGKLRTDVTGIAYVPQQAWIQNMSLKNNVVFGRAEDEKHYQRVLQSCALEEDLEVLPAGDETEIGENGINLSGGQKQRVSLARAAYGDAELYLLDDPLSAVDAHVAEHLFQNLIGPNGILSEKTRLLATHNLTYLSLADKILLLQDGKIAASGGYQELRDGNKIFQEYVRTASLLDKKKEDEEHEEEDVEKDGAKASPSGSRGRVTEEERTSDARVSFRHLLYFFRMMNYFAVVLAVVLFNLPQAVNILSTYVLSLWSEDGGGGSSGERSHSFYLSLFAALIAAQAVCDFSREYLLGYRFAVAAGRVHDAGMRGVLASPMAFFDANPVGRIVNRFSQDLQVIDAVLPRLMSGCVWILTSGAWTLFLIGYFIPVLIVGLVAVVAVVAFIQTYVSRTKRQLKRLEANARSPLFSHFSETVRGAAVIRAFGHSDRFLDENDSLVSDHLACRYVLDMSSKWIGLRVECLCAVVVLMASVGAVHFRDEVPAGVAALVLTYSYMMLDFVGYAVYLVTEIESDSISLERLREYAFLPPEGGGGESSGVLEKVKVDEVDGDSWPSSGEIKFVDYSTRYRPDLEDVLDNVNLEIRDGERIGVCGRTGAGKSSLTLALLRILEASSGKIELGGKDVSGEHLRRLRSAVTTIPQDPTLFSGSLRTNVDPTEVKSDSEVWDALEMAGLTAWAKGLDGGLEFAVSEGGRNLSAGQRQLVCLARALARRSQTRVLLLDEATSAVDHATDVAVQRAVAEGFKGRTVLTVAHRLGTIAGGGEEDDVPCDRVLVMARGKVAEVGPPRELMKDEGSAFHRMCKDAGLI